MFPNIDDSSVMTGSLNIGGHRVTNVDKPISAEDVVTKNYADSLIGSSHLVMNGNKINNMKESSARSDGATKGYVDNMLFVKLQGSTPMIGGLNLGGHKISDIAYPVDTLDAVSNSYMEAVYVKRDGELDMSIRQITNAGEPINAQDVATRNYVDSVLAHEKLDSQLLLLMRTAGVLEVEVNDTARPTLKLVFTLKALTYVEDVESQSSCSTFKSAHIVSTNDGSDLRNRREYIKLVVFNDDGFNIFSKYSYWQVYTR
jgi:hypothetical protein